ncbi:MAG: PAS domain-containing protein [Kineosporiaceae bacterium]|nr:PAS domain-containing protein [Kineosporiaceae bacterium]
MRQATIELTGVERHLPADDFIVTKTDTRGVITYVNEVFITISGYSQAELLGKPHNLVRHPDMPMAVFKLLWDTIDAKREIFAYVVNLAKNGDHYWVFAHVTPTFNRSGHVIGYHSNRRAPHPAATAAVVPLYQQMRRAELACATPREGMAASGAILQEFLDEQGMTYDELIWTVTP